MFTRRTSPFPHISTSPTSHPWPNRVDRFSTSVGLIAAAVAICPEFTFAQPGLPSPSEPAIEPAQPTPGPAPTPEPSARPKPAETRPAIGLVDLRPKFKVGQSRRLKMENVSVSKLPKAKLPGLDEDPTTKPPSGPGTPKPATSRPGTPATKPSNTPSLADTTTSTFLNEFTLVFTPTAIDESSTATVDVVFEAIKAKVESEFANDTFDSTKPAPNKPKPSGTNPLGDLGETPLLEQTLRPLVGEKITLTIDRDGNITNVAGGDKLAALFQSSPAGGLPGTGSGATAASLFGPIFTAAKSKGHASVGESWTIADKLSLSMLGDITMQTRHTLRSHAAARATVEISGAIQPGSAAPDPGKPFSLRACEHAGSYVWNTDDGFVESMTSNQSMKVDFSFAGMSGTADSTQTTKVTRIR